MHLIIKFSKFLVSKRCSCSDSALLIHIYWELNLEEVDVPRFSKRNRHTPWEGACRHHTYINYYTAQEFSSTGTELPVLHWLIYLLSIVRAWITCKEICCQYFTTCTLDNINSRRGGSSIRLFATQILATHFDKSNFTSSGKPITVFYPGRAPST